MREYELAIILQPELKAEDREKLLEKIKKIVADADGKVEKVDDWGKKELAYPIKKFHEGYFLVLSLSCSPQGAPEIQEKVGLDEKIIRNLLVLEAEGR